MNKYALVLIASSFAFFITSVIANDVSPYKISKIIDGRLVTDEGLVISLYGLQFPDSAENPGEFKQAIDRLQALVLQGQVRLDASLFKEIGAEKNRYGDWHGKIVNHSGTWVQEELVEKGFVWWSGAAKYPKKLRAALVAAEQRAEEARSGIWHSFKAENANTLSSLPKFSDFVIAEARVQNVYSSAKMTYINFGESWKSDFTAAVSSKNKRKFESQGWKLSSLMHKLVRIRGPVRWYNGPFMELSFPEQLDISSPQSN
ncbi:MAG: thermonuclease family protein [Sneathiella sp.]